jgi:hypothetical protein
VTTELDSRYVAARRILLDALVALSEHAGAIVVAGAQAVWAEARALVPRTHRRVSDGAASQLLHVPRQR